MKSFKLIIAVFAVVCAASCTKEDVKYKKMPDSGNIQIECPDNK